MRAPDLADGFAWVEEVQFGEELLRLSSQSWPNFITEQSDLPDTGTSIELDAEEYVRRYPHCGIRKSADGALVAELMTALLRVDPNAAGLPEGGWQWAFQEAAKDGDPNALCLLVANVDKEHAGQGLAQKLLEKGKTLARERGLSWIVAPVRPTLKAKFPLLPMDEYVALKNEKGEIYDPWLRAHVRAGAEILNACPRSTVVRASLAQWERWTGLSIVADSRTQYVIAGGLAPLEIDRAQGVGTYSEPGVWVRYQL